MNSDRREFDWFGSDWREYIIELPELNNVRHHNTVKFN